MNITVEISMFPFQNTYKDLIKQFIKKLNEYSDLKVTSGPTATVILGEYAYVMKVVTEMLQWSYEEHGKAVFVTKFFPGYEPTS